jgi:phosphoribosylformylglycinamidine cyclo-ligase
VHVSYGPLVQALLRHFNKAGTARDRAAASRRVVKALAHITGGGFIDNIPRVLPSTCDVTIQKGSWQVLPIFDLLARHGRVPETELYQVFNMGIGMVILVSAAEAPRVLSWLRAQKVKAWRIGEVTRGRGEVKFAS